MFTVSSVCFPKSHYVLPRLALCVCAEISPCHLSQEDFVLKKKKEENIYCKIMAISALGEPSRIFQMIRQSYLLLKDSHVVPSFTFVPGMGRIGC